MLPIDRLYRYKSDPIVDSEDITEMARQMFQDRLLTRCMGGMVPELPQSELEQYHSVLDIGCGPGGWVLEMAYAHPAMQIVGIDLSPTIVRYATATALSQGLNNVHFEAMDATKSLTFADDSFDMVNIRLAQSFVDKDFWPAFLRECWRITRSGGIVRVTEGDWGATNSLACERLIGSLARSFAQSGRSFSLDGRHMGLVTMLSKLMRESGLVDVKRKIHAIDYSADSELHTSTCQNFLVFLRARKPFLVEVGGIEPGEFEWLYAEAQRDMLLDDFCGIASLVTAWGYKPAL